MNTSSNIFQNLAFSYSELLNDIYDQLPVYYNKYSITSTPGYIMPGFKVNLDKKLKEDIKIFYSIVEKQVIDISDNTKWLDMVMHFIEFIRVAEKCFMYNNDDSNQLYADIDTSTSTSILYCIINQLGVKLRISFQDSAINIINSARNSSLLGFINNEEEEHNNVIFIQLDIGREFGKCMKNEYKFILGSSIPFNDETDGVLFENSKRLISTMIFNCYLDILNNYITKIAGVDVKVKEVLENDRLWIR